MKRKVLSLIGFVAILVSIITISWNQKAYALENNESSVTTRFVDYDNLNSLEQNQVKQGKIDDIVQHDCEGKIRGGEKIERIEKQYANTITIN